MALLLLVYLALASISLATPLAPQNPQSLLPAVTTPSGLPSLSDEIINFWKANSSSPSSFRDSWLLNLFNESLTSALDDSNAALYRCRPQGVHVLSTTSCTDALRYLPMANAPINDEPEITWSPRQLKLPGVGLPRRALSCTYFRCY